jgi:Uma2 family endonuclease
MTVAEQLEAPPVQAQPARVENRVVLYGIDWPSYTKFLEAVGHRRIRLTYDRGTLEIMTVSGTHDWWKGRFGFALKLLGRLVKLEVQGYGHTTLRRQDLDRGLEPDEGFYIRTTEVRGPREIDLNRDPPPDLGIEINISYSSLNRMAIYAALKILEVWRFDGENLRAYRLRTDGTYEECARSSTFPILPLAEFVRFLQETDKLSDSAFIDAFEAWVHNNVLTRQQEPGNGAGQQP